MTNPVLIEVTRNDVVESRHRGAFALCDADGGLVAGAGDFDTPIFPRSSVKALQALPLMEAGLDERFALTDAELAVICASHGGEDVHLATAAGLLAKVGRGEDDLECGVHWPTSKAAARSLTLEHRRPGALHNNCSGKHAGFLCLACGMEAEPAGYVAAQHPVQRAIRATLEDVYGVPLSAPPGIDGCSIPTYAVPLRPLARAFARLGTGVGFEPRRAAGARRLREAVAAAPVLIAGEGMLDTRLAERFGTRLFTKMGAEGVFCAAFPERGLGLALKCDDGALRGSQSILVELVAAIMDWGGDERAAFADVLDPVLRNWNGIEVGRVRGTAALAMT